MGYMGTHILMFVPRFSSIKPEQRQVCSYQTTGFLHEGITLAYSVFLEELSSGLFSVIGLFGNPDFLSLLAGFPDRTRRTYLANKYSQNTKHRKRKSFDH